MDFELEAEMTDEEITEKITELIAYMKTDECWLEHGGNCPKDYECAKLSLLHSVLMKENETHSALQKNLEKQYLPTCLNQT